MPEHIEESSTSQDYSSAVRETLREASNTAHTKAVRHNFIAKRFTSPDFKTAYHTIEQNSKPHMGNRHLLFGLNTSKN